MLELEELHSNKKEWPQNRNYKMFRQWFHIERSAAVMICRENRLLNSDEQNTCG